MVKRDQNSMFKEKGWQTSNGCLNNLARGGKLHLLCAMMRRDVLGTMFISLLSLLGNRATSIFFLLLVVLIEE